MMEFESIVDGYHITISYGTDRHGDISMENVETFSTNTGNPIDVDLFTEEGWAQIEEEAKADLISTAIDLAGERHKERGL